MSRIAAIRVHYDDRCELCRRSRRWVEDRDVRGAVEFVPLHDVEREAGATTGAESLADLVVYVPGKPQRIGYAAWITVLGALPRWERVSRLLALPPFSWVGPAVYRFVARHRRIVAAPR